MKGLSFTPRQTQMIFLGFFVLGAGIITLLRAYVKVSGVPALGGAGVSEVPADLVRICERANTKIPDKFNIKKKKKTVDTYTVDLFENRSGGKKKAQQGETVILLDE